MRFDDNGRPPFPIAKAIGTGAAVIIALVVIGALFGSVYQIDSTEIGVIRTWGKISPEPLTAGMGFKIPYMQAVDTMNIQIQKYPAPASAASKDLQDVQTQVTTNYRVDPLYVPWIYQNLGMDFADKVIQPGVQEVVKAATAKFNAEELITRREDVRNMIEQGLKSKLTQYHILITGVSITEFTYSKQFSDAIEAKVTAVQLRDKAANDLERIKIERDQKIAQAEADMKYATPEMIELKQIEVQKLALEKWNGVMPQIIAGGDGNMPFLMNVGAGLK